MHQTVNCPPLRRSGCLCGDLRPCSCVLLAEEHAASHPPSVALCGLLSASDGQLSAPPPFRLSYAIFPCSCFPVFEREKRYPAYAIKLFFYALPSDCSQKEEGHNPLQGCVPLFHPFRLVPYAFGAFAFSEIIHRCAYAVNYVIRQS